MIIRKGNQTFEFQDALELPRPVHFASPEHALTWLKQLGSMDPDFTPRLREYAGRSSADPEFARLTDHDALSRLANLLHLGKIVVVVRENRTGGGSPTPTTAAPAPAFPLSERAPKTAPAPPPAAPPPAGPAVADPAATACSLCAASASGQAFAAA